MANSRARLACGADRGQQNHQSGHQGEAKEKLDRAYHLAQHTLDLGD